MQQCLCIFFVATCLFYTSLGQPTIANCSSLNIGVNFTTPISGNQLRFCNRTTQQCCSNSYFSSEESYYRNNALIDGLREQITGTRETLNNINEDLVDYIDNFIPTLVRLVFGSNNGSSVFEENLKNNFYIRPRYPGENEFTVEGFTEGIIQSQINFIVFHMVRPLIDGQFNSSCIEKELLQLRNAVVKERLDRSIQALRLAVTAVRRIDQWFTNTFLQNLTRYFTPLDICVNAFITLRCESCVRNIPPLCRGVCNSVIYGCYAVFQNGLKGQFNVLWNVTNQLIGISRTAVRNISTLPFHLFNVNFSNETQRNQNILRIALTCNLSLRSSFDRDNEGQQNRKDERDEVNDEMLTYISENATRLLRTGIISYGNKGAEYCRGRVNINCWNGTAMVDTYNRTFDNTTIEGQRNNPYFHQVSVQTLMSQVQQLGNPVTDYLNSEEFLDVAPEQLIIPEDMPSTGNLRTASIIIVVLLIATVMIILN